MVAAFVATRTSGFSAGVEPVLSAGFAPTVGNLLVCGLLYDAETANYVPSLTSAKGNSWTRQVSQATTTVGGIDLWTCPVVTGGAGETMSLTYSQANGTSIVWIIQEVSGVDLANPVDKVGTITVSAANASTLTTTASASTSQADEIVFGLFEHNSATAKTWTVGAGYSAASLASNGGTTINPWWGAMESKVVSATGTQTASASLSAAVGAGLNMSGLVVTLKGATAATNTGAWFPFMTAA